MPGGACVAEQFRGRPRCAASCPLILGACLGALTACSLGPRYHRPDIRAPEAWLTPSDASAQQWPTTEWWRGFASSDLDEFIGQAQRANDDLRAAIARVQQADAQRRIAGAPLLPALDAHAQATRARSPVSGSGFNTGNDFSPLLNASYELDFWGKNRATLAAATAAARASRYDRTTVELAVMAGVATSYFQALELRDRLSVAEANLANAAKVLKGLQLERTAGTATALDVVQQQTVVATLNAAIPPLRSQLRQSLDALAILVGSTPEAVDLTHGSLDDLSAQPAGAPGTALGAAGAASGRRVRGGTADRRQRQHRGGTRRALPQHFTHRHGRLRERGARIAPHAGEPRVVPRCRRHTTDIRRRRAGGPVPTREGALRGAARRLPQGRHRRARQRRGRTDCPAGDGRAGGAATLEASAQAQRA